MYCIVVFTPERDTEKVKQAMFDAGAGKLGNYAECCWQTKGQGQFRPSEGSNAHIGEVGQLETVSETRMEMLCRPSALEAVKSALAKNHPYEEPAYFIFKSYS